MPDRILTSQEIIDIATNESLTLADEADIIAHSYHSLFKEMAKLVGGEDLNWCGFAQWSSKAIGFSLQLSHGAPYWKRLREAFRIPSLFGAPVRAIVLRLLGGSYSKGLSIANRSIFLEIGTLYTSLLNRGFPYQPEDNARFATHKLVGPANSELLPLASRMLRESRDAKGDERSALILGASIALSAYEQARAQPALEFVFYRPVRWLLRVSWKTPYYLITRKPFERYKIYTECHDKQCWLVRKLEGRFVRLYARVLALDTPLGPIWLRRKLDVPKGEVAPLLNMQFKGEVENLINHFINDRKCANVGVSDWLDYRERMRFIVNYFMTYQKIAAMSDDPYPVNDKFASKVVIANVAARLPRVIPVPRIADPALEDLEDITVVAVKTVYDGAPHSPSVAPPWACPSQCDALALSMVGAPAQADSTNAGAPASTEKVTPV